MASVLPTYYKHYAFRSRTEARWAVFLDLAYVVYRYEYEGFDLGGGWYLPDFWLPEHQIWLEIKGDMPTTEEREKAQQLAAGTGHPVVIFGGDVWHTTPGYLFLPQQPDRVQFPCFWVACDTCYSVGIIAKRISPPVVGVGMCTCWRQGTSHPGSARQTGGSRGIAAAFQAARQARFEQHDETDMYE
jgi:hypothetical protein